MERLTEWSYLAGVMVGDLKAGVDNRKAFDRLATYEDTGLEPEEIKTILERYHAFRSAISDETGQPLVSWTRASEICRAEKDGRLVVLPCKVGDLLYEIDLPEYGIITCKALEINTYFGPFLHAAGNPMVSTLAERDAAVEDLAKRPHPSTCKHGEHCDYISVITGRPDCYSCDEWEWRGPQKGDGHGDLPPM